MNSKTNPPLNKNRIFTTLLVATLVFTGCNANTNLTNNTAPEEIKKISVPQHSNEEAANPETVEEAAEFFDEMPEANEEQNSAPESEVVAESVKTEALPEGGTEEATQAEESSKENAVIPAQGNEAIVTEEGAEEDPQQAEKKLYRVGLQDYTQQAFAQAVKNNETVLVDVYAPWCPTCQANVPYLAGAVTQVNEAGGKVVVFQVNYDTEGDFLKTYDISFQSTYLIFKAGAEAARVHGLMSQEAFAELIS